MRNLLCCFLLVLVCVGGSYAHPVKDVCISRNEIAPECRSAIQAQVLITYQSQIGVRESIGANDSKEIREYLKSVGIDFPAPYCAAFVCWGLTVNHICNPQTAWSPSLFPRDHLIDARATPPEPCDAFGVYFNNLGRIAHAGVIKYWPREGDTFISIEANTNDDGSRNGNGNYLKRSPKRRAAKISRWI